jgi:TolB-like protein/Tfp pilus assembly protein PilF
MLTGDPMSLFNELKRRNVIRVAMAYVVAAWLIIQVVETILPAYGMGDAAIRLVVSLLTVAFIPTLVFSWVFEITPEGLKREVDVASENSITRFTGKKLDRIIMVLLALGMSYFAFDKFVLDPVEDVEIAESAHQEGRSEAITESYGDKSIAVLPFVNMSSDPEQEYFSDGISEELLNLLAQIPKLRVISRSSAFSFKGKDIPIPTVAEQLKVAHVLEGSVRTSGNRVRITAQLIEARSDSHLWSESYDRELDDIFAVQDEIAAAISEAMKVTLMPDVETVMQPMNRETAKPAAYDAYLQARELVHLRGKENLEQAVSHLERSLRLDNDFAPAHAQLAIATTLLVDHPAAYGALSLEEVRRRALPHLDRAQALEPNSAEAYGGRALLAHFSSDLNSMIEYARKSLASNPSNVDAMNWLYAGLIALSRYEEADATLEQMLEIDPLTIIGRLNYIGWLCSVGRVQEAHAMADQLLDKSLEFGYLAHADASLIYEGRIAEGLAWALRAPAGNFYITFAFIWTGEFDEARRNEESQDFWVDLAEGRFEEAIRTAKGKMQMDPENEETIANVADMLYLAGRVDEALPLYEQVLEFAPKGRPISTPMSDVRMIWLALTRRKAGDEEGAQAAIEIVKQDQVVLRAAGRINQEQLQTEAMIAAFEHDAGRVITAMELAIELGLRNPQVFDDPIFDNLRDDLLFVGLQQELDAILADEHKQVLQLICFNNPAPNEWQPMPETCEGVDKLQN